MNRSTRLLQLKQRAALLEARGPHNAKIIKKIKRQIKKLEGEE